MEEGVLGATPPSDEKQYEAITKILQLRGGEAAAVLRDRLRTGICFRGAVWNTGIVLKAIAIAAYAWILDF